MFVRLSDRLSVSGQLSPDDIATAAAAGFVGVVNNRPDDESPGQPSGASVAAAAQAAGLDYMAIPVTPGSFSMAQIEAMVETLRKADGPVLAFCRSGTRSAMLWALAAAHGGDDPDAIMATAAAAGYDVSGLSPALKQLAGR